MRYWEAVNIIASERGNSRDAWSAVDILWRLPFSRVRPAPARNTWYQLGPVENDNIASHIHDKYYLYYSIMPNIYIYIYKMNKRLHQSVACTICIFLAATKQLYKWYFPSVCLSVRLSVRLSVTPFSPCSHPRIIMKFSGVITMVKSDVHAKGQGQRSKVKVTEVNTQPSRFRTLTPVWIHIWQWNHAHSWKQHRRGALLFFKVISQIWRSHGSKNRRIWPRLGVSGL